MAMGSIHTGARRALWCFLLAAAAAGCSKTAQDEGAPAAPPGAQAQVERDAPGGSEGASGFDLAAVPVSRTELGEFPYLQFPAGYLAREREGSDLDRVAFWTGDGLEWVEGRVSGAGVVADEKAGKKFSLLEYQRGMQAAILAAGGRSIAQGNIPRALRDQLQQKDPDLNVRYNAGMGDIWNQPVETFVIRREDRVIWIQVTGYEYGGSLLIAETAPIPAAAA